MNELISVIMPVYNGAAFLPYALQSVDAQAWDTLEILLIDDGSTDNTAAIARAHPKVRYHYQDHRGIAEAMNAGLRLARGQYITFLDADDWWPDHKLSLQYGLLSRSSAPIAVGHVQPVTVVAEGGERTAVPLKAPHPLLNLGSALFKTSVFSTIGHFDPDLHIYADWDWFLRAREASIEMLVHPEVALFYLRHAGNVTNQRTLLQRNLALLFKKSLARRRTAGRTGPLPDFGDFLENCGRTPTVAP